VFPLFLLQTNTFYTKVCGKIRKEEESVRIIDVVSIQIYSRESLYVHIDIYIHTQR